MLLPRDRLTPAVAHALARSRGVVLVGPRQAGKSTLARSILPREPPNYFDLEYPAHVQRLSQPAQVLERLDGLVVIDEVQRMPELFPRLRVLMDRFDRPRTVPAARERFPQPGNAGR